MLHGPGMTIYIVSNTAMKIKETVVPAELGWV